ncbi:MAG TPA: glycosyltransferase, partial [Thermoanaerobaculia bacterium]|nr:glycosyltransferase [Thermoanaerobaculia bacterium]
MTPGEPLISVVIPTRERAAKLRYTLQTVLSQPGDDFEVVVSDNASEDATAETVSSFRDSRL